MYSISAALLVILTGPWSRCVSNMAPHTRIWGFWGTSSCFFRSGMDLRVHCDFWILDHQWSSSTSRRRHRRQGWSASSPQPERCMMTSISPRKTSCWSTRCLPRTTPTEKQPVFCDRRVHARVVFSVVGLCAWDMSWIVCSAVDIFVTSLIYDTRGPTLTK